MNERQRQLRTRRRRQGAVLAEAVIAISMITMMLACALFAHSAYAHKLDKLYEARNGAWGATHPHCENDGRGEAEPVEVSFPGGIRELTLEIGAVTEFDCNEEPNEHDDLISVFEWAWGAGGDVRDQIYELVDAVIENVGG